MIEPDELRGFLDAEGKLKQWPSKPQKRALALQYLSDRFEKDRLYSEREVNEILKAWHTFSDWALLRREMVESGLFTRQSDATQYRLADPKPE